MAIIFKTSIIMAKMELTEEQWQKLGQHLPQDGDFLFSLLPNSDYMLNAVRHGVVLNSRMLVYLLLTERASLVFTLIAAAEKHTDGVYDFMCTVCGENAAMDFIVRHELKDMYRHLTPAYLRDRELWELLAENGKALMRRIGIQDQFGQSAPYERLLEMNGITADNIVKQAEELLLQKSQIV